MNIPELAKQSQIEFIAARKPSPELFCCLSVWLCHGENSGVYYGTENKSIPTNGRMSEVIIKWL